MSLEIINNFIVENSPYLIWSLSVLGFIMVLVYIWTLPDWLYKRRLSRITRNHFSLTCGKRQLRELKTALKKLQKEIAQSGKEIAELQKAIRGIESSKLQEIERVLTSWIVYGRLIEAPGIGPTLRDRIISVCFDGTLNSIGKAPYIVHGVGSSKGMAIANWLAYWNSELPGLMRQNFEGREEIVRKFGQEKAKLNKCLRTKSNHAAQLKKLVEASRAATQSLDEVRRSDFFNCFVGEEKNIKQVHWYIRGIYPAWEEPPEWYNQVVTRVKES